MDADISGSRQDSKLSASICVNLWPIPAAELLRQAHAAAEKMGIPEAAQLREIMDREGF